MPEYYYCPKCERRHKIEPSDMSETLVRCVDCGCCFAIKDAIQQSAQADLANDSANEVDPIIKALRNLGDAITPPSR